MTALENSLPEEAILDFLKDGIGDDYKIALPNIPFSPVVGTAYYRSALLPIPSERLGFGNADKHGGILQVDAVVPSKKGAPLAITMARVIEVLFDRKSILTDDGVKINIIDAPKEEQHRSDADWYVVPVSIIYTILN